MTLVREHQDICTSSFSHSSVVTTLFSSTKQCRYLSQVVTLNYVHYIYIYIYIYIYYNIYIYNIYIYYNIYIIDIYILYIY